MSEKVINRSEKGRKRKRLFSHAAENGIFWMVIFLGTLGVLSLFSAGRQAIQTGGGKVRALAEGRSHKTAEGFLPICSVDNGRRQAALTFEVGKGIDGVREILSILEANQVKASFFVNETWAKAYPQEVREMAGKGHDLGCLEGQGASAEISSHQNQPVSKVSLLQQELMEAGQCIFQITGQEMELFRPVSGSLDDDKIIAACGMGYYPVLWDVDSQDWKDYGAAQIVTQVLENPDLKDGSIVRFHCGVKYTPEALAEIITGFKEQGYDLVPLSEMVIQEKYHLDEEGRQEARVTVQVGLRTCCADRMIN
ncbi:MAG: polysaccharide deacetylase family protein [Lachnospiraceae bacterium]|nr:polysaccharide deacetylase family protein [Lachnospiraceae bacterium]